jgi:hypothetical protein
MRSSCLGLLVAFALVLPAFGADDKKKKDTPVPTTDSDSFTQGGEFVGKLINPPSTDGTFVLEIQIPRYELKPGTKVNNTNNQLIKEQQHLNQIQNQMAKAKTTQQYLHALQQYQNVQMQLANTLARAAANNPFIVKYDKKDITFHTAETLKVRNMNLPSLFDEKGNPKKYTDAEKAELKGKDKNLPGYEATINDLTAGQTVKVTLSKAPTPKKTDAKDENKDETTPEHKWLVKLIVILEDAKDTGSGKDTKKKN